VFFDYLIRSNYLGNRVKNYYLNFLELDFLTRNIIIFTVLLLMFSLLGFILGLLDISLFNLLEIDPYKNKFFNNLGEDGLINNDVSTSVNSTTTTSTSTSTTTTTTTPVNTSSDGSSSGGSTRQTLDLSSSINHNKTDNVTNVGNIAPVVKDSNLNVNLSNVHLKVPVDGLYAIAGAVSATGGASVGYQVLKNMPGTPVVKVAGAAAAMLATQATTLGITKGLSSINKSDTQNFIGNIISNRSILEDKYPDFPLNLLPEISQLVDAELLFLIILLNLFVSKLFLSIDFPKYLPKNKLGLILGSLINRYIKFWNLNSKLFIGFCWLMLFFCVLSLKLFIY